MKRSHRIVRELHATCVAGRERAKDAGRFDHVGEATDVAVALRALEKGGFCDPSLLDAFEDAVGAAVKGALLLHGPAVREAAADDAAVRLFEGRTYRNRLDRQLVVGASAVAACMIRERILAAAFEVVRELAETFKHEAYPAAVPAASFDAWRDADLDPEDGAYLKPARFAPRAGGGGSGGVAAPAGRASGRA